MRQRGAKDTYITACMSSTKYHNDTSVHMVFQLVQYCTWVLSNWELKLEKRGWWKIASSLLKCLQYHSTYIAGIINCWCACMMRHSLGRLIVNWHFCSIEWSDITAIIDTTISVMRKWLWMKERKYIDLNNGETFPWIVWRGSCIPKHGSGNTVVGISNYIKPQ